MTDAYEDAERELDDLWRQTQERTKREMDQLEEQVNNALETSRRDTEATMRYVNNYVQDALRKSCAYRNGDAR